MNLIELLKILLEYGEVHPFSSSNKDALTQLLLHDTHPKQIVSKLSLKAMIHEVEYEYTTSRGNRKQGKKIFVIEGVNIEIDLEIELRQWVTMYNIDNKHRQLLNVKFLSSKRLAIVQL